MKCDTVCYHMLSLYSHMILIPSKKQKKQRFLSVPAEKSLVPRNTIKMAKTADILFSRISERDDSRLFPGKGQNLMELFISLGWLIGNFTGNDGFYHQNWVVPAKCPINQYLDHDRSVNKLCKRNGTTRRWQLIVTGTSIC